MRFAEIALLLVPVAIAIAWWCGVRGLSRTGIIAVAAGLVAMGLILLWLGEGRSVRGIYVPAQLQGGEIIQGRGQK
jgi:hypothetical protein